MWEQHKSPAGYYRISTPEMTVYNPLRYPRACPSLDLAATILAELGERIEVERLALLTDLDTETSVLQRLRWCWILRGGKRKPSLWRICCNNGDAYGNHFARMPRAMENIICAGTLS